MNKISGRFSVFLHLLMLYLLLSTSVRIAFYIWSYAGIDSRVFSVLRLFFYGFLFDLSVGFSFFALYLLYLFLLPRRLIGSLADRWITYLYIALVLVIIYFSLMAEFPFWDEFGTRFNFIAVDYLIYTYEVMSNINESYPIPLILVAIALLVVSTFYWLRNVQAFHKTFTTRIPISKRAVVILPLLAVSWMMLMLLKNKQAEFSSNRYVNEIAKNGVFSFFAALRSNELDYAGFYPTINERDAYDIVKNDLLQNNQRYTSNSLEDISRNTLGTTEFNPNIFLIAIESFSADFLGVFGNTKNLTPAYDSLAKTSIFFTNLYATGTRTVRGMEALTLCVPPTPGNSIVRRPNNSHLFSVATILKEKKYHCSFLYGGDGYFDNMNTFFGGQGFDIIDRDRGNPLSEDVETTRYPITSDQVSFENAWGICDEDLYTQALLIADKKASTDSPFFQFIMTTSNHKPYTFPEHTINMPQGSRDAAVRYTDYALGKFIATARTKPWFANSVFVIVADHCASSAGKWEINIDKHHIPAILYNLPTPPQKIDRLASQIDIMPTLFGYLGWTYNTQLYGHDINQVSSSKDRAFIGNYRTLGVLKDDIYTQINDHKKISQFMVDEKTRQMRQAKEKKSSLISTTIAYYQTTSERFKSGKMKVERTSSE